jgi:hypothetical protein
MRVGAHLPLADLGDGTPTGEDLRAYADSAKGLGYATLSANDHLVWGKPWLDGPTSLASVIAAAGDLTLATSITLPVVRHPVVVAKINPGDVLRSRVPTPLPRPERPTGLSAAADARWPPRGTAPRRSPPAS